MINIKKEIAKWGKPKNQKKKKKKKKKLSYLSFFILAFSNISGTACISDRPSSDSLWTLFLIDS
jgi:hypothetical protein